MTRFGMDVRLAHPEGYDLIPETMERGQAARRQGPAGQVQGDHSMEEAFKGADIVYPKSWAPVPTSWSSRTELLREGDKDGSRSWRRSAWRNNAKFKAGSAPSS